MYPTGAQDLFEVPQWDSAIETTGVNFVVVYILVVHKMNLHWLRITKHFGYCLTSIFVGARRLATPFIQRSMSAEELHEIISLLHTLYIVLMPIHINTNSINILNLLVL